MINIYDIWSNLIKSLKAGLPNHTFIKANQNANLPDYPYVVLNILNPYIKSDSLKASVVRDNIIGDETIVKITKKETPKMVFSISCYSESQSEASQILKESVDWLTFSGLQDLHSRGIVILNNSEITDRTSFLEVDYQYVFGFDLTIRVQDDVSMNVDTIGNVEATNELNNEIIEI